MITAFFLGAMFFFRFFFNKSPSQNPSPRSSNGKAPSAQHFLPQCIWHAHFKSKKTQK